MDWQDGLHDFSESNKSMKSPQIPVQTIYDIVKAHGGELKVETTHIDGLPADSDAAEQAGSEFIIQ